MSAAASVGAILALLALAAVVALAALVGGLARRSTSHRDWTDEEYERRRDQAGSGVLAASMKVLDAELGPGGRRVADEREALERGAYEGEQGRSEPPG